MIDTAPRKTEAVKVRDWRAAELERAGYPPDIASRIADRLYIDLHEAIDLAKAAGPELAERILT